MLIAGISLAFSCFMITGLIYNDENALVYYSIIPSFALGVFGCRFVITLKANELAAIPMKISEILYSTFSFW